MNLRELLLVLTTWDADFEAKPAGSRSPKYGDDDIRELKGAIRERLDKEFVMSLSPGTAVIFKPREGSARAYYQSGTGPTVRPDGTTSLGTADDGRIWFDEGEGYVPHVWTGSAWQGFQHEIARISIQGSLATTGSGVPPIIFPRKCDVQKVSARVGTAPTTTAIIFDLTRMYSGGLVSASLFKTGTFTIGASSFAAAKTIGQMTAVGYSLTGDDYLRLSITQVGTSTKGADLAVTIEVLLETSR